MKNNLKSNIACFLEDRSGVVTATAAIWLSLAGVALIGLCIDGANLYRVKDALQQSSDRAAVAGAAQLAASQSAALSTANTYSSISAAPAGVNGINAVQSVTGTITASCVWSLLAGNPTTATVCPGSGANVISVAQTATVNTFFGLGLKTVTAASAATANGGGGGLTGNLDVVIIINSTGSMNSCENGSGGCSPHAFAAPISCPAPTPSWSGSSTKMQAAELAVQTLLCGFTPASGTGGAQVALMTFPGVSNPSVDYCGTTGTAAPVVYSSTTNYQIVPFSSDFKTSAGSTTLNANSNLVKAMGGNASCAGLQAKGGKGTYYAGAITAAQTYLTNSGRSGAQKVIVLLSDGDANATSGSEISASLATNQCQQGVTAADTAATAGTWVFSVAYNSSGTCSTDKGTYKGNACLAMQNIASSKGLEPDKSKFFAYNGTGSGANCKATNASMPTLAATFKAAMQNFTAARLINPNCVTSENCNL